MAPRRLAWDVHSQGMPSTISLPLATTPRTSALVNIGRMLGDYGYRFTTVTPLTHGRVLFRSGPRPACDPLRDLFGWNRWVGRRRLPVMLLDVLETAGLVDSAGDQVRSRVRFSSIEDRLYAHDAYPTAAADAVFFGPDTMRFVAAVRRLLRPCGLLVDLCCGAGAGGLEVQELAGTVILADISPVSLEFAAANRRLQGANEEIGLFQGDLLTGWDQRPDAIIANPPYLVDRQHRLYRDGGGDLGLDLALRIVDTAIARLWPGGQLILYTGTPVFSGTDAFLAAVRPRIEASGAEMHYEEVDPDIFGEELEQPAYASADRIAAVVLSLTMPR